MAFLFSFSEWYSSAILNCAMADVAERGALSRTFSSITTIFTEGSFVFNPIKGMPAKPVFTLPSAASCAI